MSAIHSAFAHAPKKVINHVVKHATSTPANVKRLPPSAFTAKARPDIPYFVGRTKSNNIPVYNFQRSGGNKRLTKVTKIEGDVEALRKELKHKLRLEDSEITINTVTQHINVKGHREFEIKQFLEHRFRTPAE